MARMLFDLTNEDLIGVEKSFLNDYIYSKELDLNKNNRLPSKTFKPSSMKCIRNMYYQATGCENRKCDRNYILGAITESGSFRHDSIQSDILKMKDNGIDCEYVNVGDYIREHNLDIEITKEANFKKGKFETKLRSNKYNLSFLCDGIVKYKGKHYILEIKTESGQKFMGRKGIADEHKTQGATYSLVFGIRDILYLYENRDIGMKKVYHKVFTETEIQYVKNKLINCAGYVERLEVPPKEESKDNCKYCDYREQCYQDG